MPHQQSTITGVGRDRDAGRLARTQRFRTKAHKRDTHARRSTPSRLRATVGCPTPTRTNMPSRLAWRLKCGAQVPDMRSVHSSSTVTGTLVCTAPAAAAAAAAAAASAFSLAGGAGGERCRARGEGRAERGKGGPPTDTTEGTQAHEPEPRRSPLRARQQGQGRGRWRGGGGWVGGWVGGCKRSGRTRPEDGKGNNAHARRAHRKSSAAMPWVSNSSPYSSALSRYRVMARKTCK
jgi:hypothetical protein